MPDSTDGTAQSNVKAGLPGPRRPRRPHPSTISATGRDYQDGVAVICLSGGGYRAMVFHLGALWRLNEAGLLKGIDWISSVSGGSITAGLLGLKWKALDFDEARIARRTKPRWSTRSGAWPAGPSTSAT